MTLHGAARSLFWLAAAVALFLALVPGPLGMIIESGEQRHFLAFLVLPLLAVTGWPRISAVRHWLCFTAFGGAIELLQWWTALGRKAEWSDWINDMIAAAVAIALGRLLLHLRNGMAADAA